MHTSSSNLLSLLERHNEPCSCSVLEIRLTKSAGKENINSIKDTSLKVLKRFDGPLVANVTGDRIFTFHVCSVEGLIAWKPSAGTAQSGWVLKINAAEFGIPCSCFPDVSVLFQRRYDDAQKEGTIRIAFFEATTREFLPERTCRPRQDEPSNANNPHVQIRWRYFSSKPRDHRVLDPLVSLSGGRDRQALPSKPQNNATVGYVRTSCKPYELMKTRSHLLMSASKESHIIPPRHLFPGGWFAYSRPGYECTDSPLENVVYNISPKIEEALSGNAQPLTRPFPRSRHPDYEDQSIRYRTFSSWPIPADVQDVNKLAESGFYYTGQFDLVRCFHCGLGLKDWSITDDPLIEHVRYSPNCSHMARILGPERLDQIRENNRPEERLPLNEAGSNGRSRARLRHPQYQDPESRRKTFEKWPSALMQTPETLTEAGFFYTGLQDQVRCFACDGGLQHWDRDDEPWIEHARWFPHCPHVIEVRGQNFVTMVQLAISEENETDEAAGALENMTVNGATSGRESDNPIYSPYALTVINMGYSKAAVQMAIEECSKNGRRWNADVLVEVLIAKQDRGEVLPTDSPRPESPVQPKIDVSTPEGVLAENKLLRKLVYCLSCEENQADALFLPCGHHRMCMKCVADVLICPVCEKEIKQTVKTYMA